MPEPRQDMYRPIHKAIRHMLSSTSHAIGMADFDDKQVAQEILKQLDVTITVLQAHAGHEEKFVHSPLESRVPGITASIEEDHNHDDQVYAKLETLANQVRSAGGGEAVDLGYEVYRTFNNFVGEYLAHLDREESELEPALLANFTNAEIKAIDDAIMASVSPELMAEFLLLIFASFNPDELTTILGGVKASAPPHVVEGILKLAEQTMPPGTWTKVSARVS